MRYTKRLLAMACALFSVLALGACQDKQTQKQPTQIEEIYAQYVVSVEAQGQTPLSYEEWLASIKGEKGDKGDKGDMPKLQINPVTNEWEVSYDNGKTWSSLGVQATGDSTQVQSKLQFQRIAGKDEYRVVGLGMETETDIVIPATYNGMPVTEIGTFAFRYEGGAYYGIEELDDPLTHITSVTIPDSVTRIGMSAFFGCIRLERVVFGENSQLATIEDGTFYRCNLAEFTIPDSVTEVGAAFNHCENLTNVYVGAGVTALDGSAFSGCDKLVGIHISEHNTHYKSVDGNLYTKDGKTLLSFVDKEATSFVVPNDVTAIGASAFYGCKNLKSITIPDSVTSIGASAFYGCKNLKSITIPDSVTSIGGGAFSSCEIQHATMPALAISSMPESYLQTVVITSGNAIDSWAFQHWYNLTNISLPDSVTVIGDYAFSNCTSLTNITISNSVTSIGDNAFAGCDSLQYNTYGNCKYLGDETTPYVVLMSAADKTLTSYTICEGTKIIYQGAFRSCRNMTDITIPDSVTSIGYSAFYYCTSLTSVVIPDGVTTIGGHAFV